MKKYEHVPIKYLEKIFDKWKKILISEEISNICFLPMTDVSFRVQQFVDWLAVGKIEVGVIDTDLDMIESGADLLNKVANSKLKKFVIAMHKIMESPERNRIVEAISQLHVKGYGILLFHEIVPSELEILGVFNSSAMSQNVQIWSLYERELIDGFIGNVCKDWGLKLANDQRDKLIGYCGGVLWWVTDVLRNLREGTEVNWDALESVISLKWKREKFFDALPDSFKVRLLDNRISDRVSDEVKNYGLISLPGMRDMVEKERERNLVILGDKLIVTGRDLTSKYSEAERRVLAGFWEKREQLVERDKIVEWWWGENVEGSDWALDQNISRLRKKIQRDGVPMKILTKKGKGYECSKA